MSFANRLVRLGIWPEAARASAPTADLVAAGTTQATATELIYEYNPFGTVGAGTAALLPNQRRLTTGDRICVANNGANALLVFPQVGGQIGTAAANASFSVPAGKSADFIADINTLNWNVILSA
jgi:hypothetical protein